MILFSEKEKKGKKGERKEENGKIREEKESSGRRAVISNRMIKLARQISKGIAGLFECQSEEIKREIALRQDYV